MEKSDYDTENLIVMQKGRELLAHLNLTCEQGDCVLHLVEIVERFRNDYCAVETEPELRTRVCAWLNSLSRSERHRKGRNFLNTTLHA